MGFHSRGNVKDLQKRLTERYEKVIQVMNGKDAHPDDPDHDSPIERSINSRDLRFALGDMETAIKEIRSQLGKP